ncbi:MAG: BREX system Lon protease-like protein BrxL [Chloroherpetonaceae bacterium]|nr:BREX system Lon protease-like protein BrxL [Chthonomonadaceae bacterium]MDW8208733.1 BREX system Lon protease-like protein BrxL [Chloroherpetonaceae bacterium]
MHVSVPVDYEALSEKTRRVFQNLAIDKRRLPASQLQKRGIPSYVGEWVLDTIVPGTGPLSPEEIEKVQAWAARAIPGPNDHNLVKSRLICGETLRILTPLQVDVILNRNRQDRIGKLSLIGIHDAHISEDLIERYPELLRGGMWGITELINTPEGVAVASFRPMQSSINLDLWKEARREFTLEEWRSLILISMGYAPDFFNEEQQMLLIARLLPLVQKNMHLIELAPKGTGKSYVYENISPRVRLVSGGNVSPAVLFVNNATGLPGILARFAVVVLDEVQTLKFEKPGEIIGGLKGYLANARLTRGGLHEMSSECGLVLLANITLDEHQRPVRDPLVMELPEFMRETAFLDRLRGMIPGWEIPKLTSAAFAQTVGLKSDFFGDAMIALRDDLEADHLCFSRIRLSGRNTYKRNEEAVRAIATGFFKILFPDRELSTEEFYRYCIRPALRMRQLIWDQLYALDAEYRQYDQQITCV